MPKTFITERDVEDMQARGVTSIDVTDSVVLTDLAVERAMKFGIKLQRVESSPPPKASFSPSVNLVAAYPQAPNRPSMAAPLPAAPAPASASNAELFARVRAAVLARLDGQVNPALLDAVIAKVLAGMG